MSDLKGWEMGLLTKISNHLFLFNKISMFSSYNVGKFHLAFSTVSSQPWISITIKQPSSFRRTCDINDLKCFMHSSFAEEETMSHSCYTIFSRKATNIKETNWMYFTYILCAIPSHILRIQQLFQVSLYYGSQHLLFISPR